MGFFLTEREILGLFDNEYDRSNVNLDIQQIISSNLAFDTESATTRKVDEIPPENIYFNELIGIEAIGTAQTKKQFRQANLSDFDRVIFDLYNPSGGGEGFASGARFLNPTIFINKFLAPKVEELVDFVKLEDLEKEIRNYSLIMKSKGYKFWTPYSIPSGAPFDIEQRINTSEKSAAIAIYGNQSGPYDVLNIRQGNSTPSSRFIERKFSSIASKFVRTTSLARRGPSEDKKNVENYLFLAGSTPHHALENIFTDKRYGIVLEPSNPEIFTQGTSLQPSVGNKIELSRKYPAVSPLAGSVPFYTKSPPTVGAPTGLGVPRINIQEDVEKILSAIERIEKNIKVKKDSKDSNITVSLFKDVYKPIELAKIIMARWALRTLADQIRQVREQIKISDNDDAVIALSEEILDAIKRERIADPDFDAYDPKTTENLSNLVQRRVEISPQCYLINNIIEAAKLNRLRLNMSQPAVGPTADIRYEKVRIVSDSGKNSAALINKLTVNKNQSKMLDLRPTDISNLYPYLRIYKTVFDQQGRVEKEAEFKFPNLTNVQSTNKAMEVIGNVTNQYTQEYGITSFNWSFVGSDPFSYANDIDATLSLHFNDFEQLVLERKTIYDGEEVRYRLLDLISISEKELT